MRRIVRVMGWTVRTAKERPERLLSLLIEAHDRDRQYLTLGDWFRSGFRAGYRAACVENGLPVPEVPREAPVTPSPVRKVSRFHRDRDTQPPRTGQFPQIVG